MAVRRYFYWGTITLMLGSFVVGVLLAAGHHLFYTSINASPATNRHRAFYGVSVPSGQQLNLAVGTAFAFLVKAAFIVSVSTAYYQMFWKYVQDVSTATQAPRLGQVDAQFSATSNILAFAKTSSMWRHFLLSLLALLVWVLPIASIITPATLSVVVTGLLPNVTEQHVPTIDFFSLNFLASMPGSYLNVGPLVYSYNGPSALLRKIAMVVTAQNVILPIPAQHPNASWELTFPGPSLKCAYLAEDEQVEIESNVAQFLRKGGCNAASTYLSWFPRLIPHQKYNTVTYTNQSYITPYHSGTNNSSVTFPPADSIFDANSNYGVLVAQNATLFIATMPNMLKQDVYTQITVPTACDLEGGGIGAEPKPTSNNPLGPVGGNVSILQCDFLNSTYRTKFRYTNNVQSVKVQLIDSEYDSKVSIYNMVKGPQQDIQTDGQCPTLTTGSSTSIEASQSGFCDFDISLLSQLSYQAVLQAFTTFITGSISFADGGEQGSSLKEDTSIRSTDLLYTKDLHYLTDFMLHQNLYVDSDWVRPDLQRALAGTNESAVSGMLSDAFFPDEELLTTKLETMFQRYVVSLMSSSAFRPNMSTTTPPKTAVTINSYEALYQYDAEKLLLAYGMAALATLSACIVGMYAIFANGGCYSNDFSTIMRTTRNAELSVDLDKQDQLGRSPLPKRLAQSTLRVRPEQSIIRVTGVDHSNSQNDVNLPGAPLLRKTI